MILDFGTASDESIRYLSNAVNSSSSLRTSGAARKRRSGVGAVTPAVRIAASFRAIVKVRPPGRAEGRKANCHSSNELLGPMRSF